VTDVVFEFSQPKGSAKNDIALTDEFIDALFSISEQIHKKEKFRTRNNGVSRLVWHVTQADLMLMVTLHVCFNSEGKVQNVTRHQIYKKLQELYEDPCCDDQFYIAFEKFVRLGLIQEKVSGVVSEYSLNPFINPETNKIGRIVVAAPFVLSKKFTDLPIAAQKFVFDLLRKQGNEKGKEVFYWLNKEKGIMKRLHKRHIYEIKNLLDLLSHTYFSDAPFLKYWHIEPKRGSRSAKLTCVIHDSYVKEYIPGKQYRDVLPGKRSHRRVIRHLQTLLAEYKIGEFEFWNNGADFFHLVRILRGKSFRFIRYVVEKLRELYLKNRVFPENVMDFIQDEIRHKGMIAYLEVAKSTGVYKFISPKKLDQDRLFEFASWASHFGLRSFERICRRAAAKLDQMYTLPPAHDHSDYASVHELDRYLDTFTLRNYAFRLQKCPDKYKDLEIQALVKIENGVNRDEVRSWMIRQIEALPAWSLIPDTPQDFRVEEYIIEECEIA
jgi:hypothetical protein